MKTKKVAEPLSDIEIRLASSDDLPLLVKLLADDPLGRKREAAFSPLPDSYREAFQAIEVDPNNQILTAVWNGRVVGCVQLTFIPSLTYQGGWRAMLEGVRVASDCRGQGIGTLMINRTVEMAKKRGCRLIQLTTDQRRPDALRFYRRLGFAPTHFGLKRPLVP